MMNLEELLDRCRSMLRDPYAIPGSTLVVIQGVVDTFGAALPCGYETPSVSTVGGAAHVSAECFVGTPEDARAYAAAIVRAADEIDGGAK